MYDSQRRSSQQSTLGHLPIENAISDSFAPENGDKYLQDSFETEKSKSKRTSPNGDDQIQSNGGRRRGSIRFYEDIQPTENVTRQRTGDTPISRQDDPGYANSGYEYKQNVQPQYSQSPQIQAQSQPKENQIYSQLEYTDQTQYNPSDGVYKTEEYDTTQYVDQQNYDSNQYGTGQLQSSGDYDLQNEYQPTNDYQGYQPTTYEQPTFQATEEPAMYQPEQYTTGLYQEGATKPTFDYGNSSTAAEQQSYTEPISSNTNVGPKYKGNGNTTSATTQRLQSMSKQPAKKKFT